MAATPTRDEVPQLVRGPSLPARRGPVPRPGAPAAAVASVITAGDIWRIVRKHVVLIIICTLAGTLCFGVGTLLWIMYAPVYEARALMRVSAPRTDIYRDTGLQNMDIMDQIKNSQMQMIMSEAVLGSTGDDESMKVTDWFKAHRQTLTEDLKESISVRSIPKTNLITISMSGVARTHKDRVELAEVANAVAKAAEDDSRARVQRERHSQITEFTRRQINLGEQLISINGKIDKQRSGLEATDPEARQSTLRLRLESELRKLMELDTIFTKARLQLAALEDMDKEGTLEDSPRVNMIVANDPSLIQLQNNVSAYRTRLKTLLRERLGAKHPTIKMLQDSLKTAQEEIVEQEEKLRKEVAVGILEELNTAMAIALEEYEKKQDAYSSLNDEYMDLQNAQLDIARLKTEYRLISSRKDKIDDHLLELQMLRETEEHLQKVRDATIPKIRSKPQWVQMVPLGVLLGLAVGLGIAFLLELVNTSIRNPADIARKVDLPLLGMIPHANDVEEDIEDLRLAFMTNPASLISEAFRQIRTSMQFSGPADQRRSVLITSSSPGDGRSTVAMNLAAAAARSGQNVLVVDANFRQPMIHLLFPHCGQAGLSNALVGQAQWRGLVHHVEEGLFVMSAGPLPPNPAELLGSDSMRRFIDETTSQYDQVIFDGPPCLVVTDACVLSTLVDSIVMVVRAGANTHGIVQRARGMFSRMGVQILGVVLDAVRATPGGYLRKNYDTFYDYQEHHEPPPPPQLETAVVGGDLPPAQQIPPGQMQDQSPPQG